MANAVAAQMVLGEPLSPVASPTTGHNSRNHDRGAASGASKGLLMSRKLLLAARVFIGADFVVTPANDVD